MRNRFMVSIWFIVALVIFSLVSAGSVLAENSVRVEPKEQCYQFIADDQPPPPTCSNPKSSIWVVKSFSGGGEQCAARVWAEYGDGLTCEQVKNNNSNLIPGQKLSDLGIKGPKGNTLSSAITTNTKCDEIWLRFADENNCNGRCFIIGGRVYCR